MGALNMLFNILLVGKHLIALGDVYHDAWIDFKLDGEICSESLPRLSNLHRHHYFEFAFVLIGQRIYFEPKSVLHFP